MPVEYPTYTISDLTGSDCANDHDSVKCAMAEWPRTELRQRGPNPRRVSVECGLDFMGRNQLWLKASKVVDIVIHDDIVYVQFEVESNHNREATVRKLSFGLSDQLRFLNNRGVDINEIVGFYVPVGRGYVEKVTCTWENESLCYTMIPTKLKRQEVLTEIRAVYTTQSGYQLESTRYPSNPLQPSPIYF